MDEQYLEKVRESVNAKGKELREKWNKRGDRFDDLGRCSECIYLVGFETQYGTRFARCDEFKRVLKPGDPVIECTAFWRKNLLSLSQMEAMAYLIEPKREIGFMGSGDNFEE